VVKFFGAMSWQLPLTQINVYPFGSHVEMTQKSKHQTPILPTAMTKPENDSLLDQDYNEKKHAEDL
jgi:hypothetical protein